MNTYTFTIQHDGGKFKLKTHAKDEQTARDMVCKAEHCPPSALVKVKCEVTLYKVVKLFRVSGRRSILRRGLTEEEAQRVVNSYPDSSRSMVVYHKQGSSYTKTRL